jgi:hypothetical protein
VFLFSKTIDANRSRVIVTYVRLNAFLAYLISVGLIGAGVAWIVFGSTSLCVGIGTASIVVGLASIWGELQCRYA